MGDEMSLKPKPPRPMPDDVGRLGDKLIAPESPYRLVGERLYIKYRDADYVDLYSPEGKPGLSPVDLSFVTAFQFLEGLSDRAVADAVRLRLDFKFALHLPLDHPGFHYSVLSEFRDRVIGHQAEERVFNSTLQDLDALGLLKRRGRQRTDSLAIVTRVRDLNRLELVVETVRLALRVLLVADPDWTRATVPPEWEVVYGERCMAVQMTEAQRRDLEARVGSDGQWLLTRVQAETTPGQLRELPEVQVLATVWAQQFEVVDEKLGFRTPGHYDGRAQIQSPHDPDARWSRKGEQEWVGDKLQVTETDDEDLPHLITDIAVTSSVETDYEALPAIQERLEGRDLLPGRQITDGGYMGAENLVTSSERGIELFGPVQRDSSRQARQPGGLTSACFRLNRETGTVTCPAGQTTRLWVKADQRVVGRFIKKVCVQCEWYTHCCTGPRGRTVSFGPHHEILEAARARQKTEAFKTEYRQHRGGVEGCLSSLVRGQRMRVARYTRRAKRHLHALFAGVGVNLRRAARWLAGIRPQLRQVGLGLAPTD